MSRVLAVVVTVLVALVGVAVPLVGTLLAGGLCVALTISVVLDHASHHLAKSRSTR